MNLEIIKKEIERLSTLIKLYIECKDDFTEGFFEENMLKFTTLKSALEKQIPAKPDYYADGYADGVLAYDYAKCPVCGKDYEYGINEWGCEYCSCGKKLDWSDME